MRLLARTKEERDIWVNHFKSKFDLSLRLDLEPNVQSMEDLIQLARGHAEQQVVKTEEFSMQETEMDVA